MPLMKLHINEGVWSQTERDVLLDVVHDVMVRTFKVPDGDRYQILNEHKIGNLRALDTGLGFERTEKFLLIEIVSRPRLKEQKVAFYRDLAAELEDKCGLLKTDLMMSFVINSDDDWSFGHGEAQFLTGALA